MSRSSSSGRIEFEFSTKPSLAGSKVAGDTPFCMALLADFSGRSNRGVSEDSRSLAKRRRFAVDVDNLETLPGELGAEIHVPLGEEAGPRVTLSFQDLDDFHPDRIAERLEFFKKLKTTRRRLQDPATFAEAASEVRSWIEPGEEPEASADLPAEPDAAAPESDADAVERLLGKRPVGRSPAVSSRARDDVNALIRDVVGSYIVPAPDPGQAELVAQVDQAISGQMRALLHHRDFQALEAAWRILHFLVDHVEIDETLRLTIVDVSKEELAADLTNTTDVRESGAYRLLVDRSVNTPGADPYALLIGGYRFDKTAEDIHLLHQLARVAQAAGAPFLAAAAPRFAGCESFAATPDPDDWRGQAEADVEELAKKLSRSPEAAYVGLALPRFLLRHPYGKDTDPIDSFEFEEFQPSAGHEQYLWGHSAAILGCLLAAAYRESGWALSSGIASGVTGIPMHVYASGGETRVTPCAEILLTERAMEVLINKGLMPVLSIRGRDAVQVPRLQSIADPPAPLAGRWE